MLNADAPNPVSTSTSSGSGEASVIRRTSVSTSSRLLMPRSGRPSDPGGDAAARKIDRLEAGALREDRVIGADGARAPAAAFSAATAARKRAPPRVLTESLRRAPIALAPALWRTRASGAHVRQEAITPLAQQSGDAGALFLELLQRRVHLLARERRRSADP